MTLQRWTKVLIAAPVFVVLGVAAAFKLVDVHTELAGQRQAVADQWAQVQAALDRRADLAPGLVESVKAIAKRDDEAFQKVAASRAALAAARTAPDKIEANDRLSDALGRVLLLSENYPKLRGERAFLRLQDEIAAAENNIAIERRKYNEILEHYNAQIQIFPDNVVASVSGFHRNDAYFRTEGATRGAPKVQF